MKAGGFDAVIGNPPYGGKLSSSEFDYLRKKYVTAEYQIDTYPLFIEKAYYLGKQDSCFGMITPSSWVASKYNAALLQLIASKTALKNVVITPKNTFVSATVETLILISVKKESKSGSFLVERWDSNEKIVYQLNQYNILNQKDYIFHVYSNSATLKLVEKIRLCSDCLSKYATAVWGVKIYQKGKGKPVQSGIEAETKIFHSQKKTKNTHKPLLGGKEIRRYAVEWKGTYVDYGEWLAEPRTPEWFVGPRILIREVTANGIIQATIVNNEFVFSYSVDGIKLKDEKYTLNFILGIVNSKVISFYHANTSANAFKGTFPKVLIKDLLNIPIRIINFSDSSDKARHDRMVAFVDQMLELNKQLESAKTDHDKTAIQRQIDATDRQINQLVYELYGLTEEEIKIVEEGSP